MGRLEVAHHPAREAELTSENLGQDVRVLATKGAVDLVVRAHDRTDMAVFHSSLERQRVDLLQGTFVELRIDLKPVFLLRVHVVVLGGGDDGVTLNALNVASGHLPRQHGVLPKRLEQATENWDASDVHSRPKQDIVSGTPCLLAQHIPVLLGRREIPGGRQGNRSRWRRRLAFVHVSPAPIDADTGWSVSESQWRDAKPGRG